MARKSWVQDPKTGKLIPKEEYVRQTDHRIYVMPDIDPYQSIITGETISSRSRHREHLRQHNCVEVGNEKQTPKKIPATPGLKEHLIRECKKHGVLND